MMLLHLYSGSSWYGSASNAQIMAQLVQPGFAVDVSDVDDDSQLRDLLQQLLQIDPKQRLQAFQRPNWYLRSSFFT